MPTPLAYEGGVLVAQSEPLEDLTDIVARHREERIREFWPGQPRILFDTSALVAALLHGHPEHPRVALWFQRILHGPDHGLISAHSLAEVILSTFPVQPRITATAAREMIRTNVLGVFQVIPLNESDYEAVIDHLAGLGIVGGAIYDALILRAADIAGVDQIVTLNERDFRQIYPALADKSLFRSRDHAARPCGRSVRRPVPRGSPGVGVQFSATPSPSPDRLSLPDEVQPVDEVPGAVARKVVAQVKSYLKTTGIRTALLVNFAREKADSRRIRFQRNPLPLLRSREVST